MANQQRCTRGRLTVVLDRDQVFPGDPGQGTPAVVELTPRHGDVEYATLWCAIGEGEICGGSRTYRLTAREIDWLESVEAIANEFLYAEMGGEA